MSNNLIEKVPNCFSNNNKLKELDLSNNLIEEINELDELEIEILNLSGNNIKNVENFFPNWKIKILDLSNNKIEFLNDKIFNNSFIKVLNLNNNSISSLPLILPTKIQNLNFGNNKFKNNYFIHFLFDVLTLSYVDSSNNYFEGEINLDGCNFVLDLRGNKGNLSFINFYFDFPSIFHLNDFSCLSVYSSSIPFNSTIDIYHKFQIFVDSHTFNYSNCACLDGKYFLEIFFIYFILYYFIFIKDIW